MLCPVLVVKNCLLMLQAVHGPNGQTWIKQSRFAGKAIRQWYGNFSGLGRSMSHLFEMNQQLEQKGVGFQSLTEKIDTPRQAAV